MVIDYRAVLTQALEELGELYKQRQEIELRLAQKEQFIWATLYQLPERERATFEGWIDRYATGVAGLVVSIRTVLSKFPRKWHTAAQVRDLLVKEGFDFGGYTSNPLASVHSSLKRLKPEEVEMTQIDGVMAWRWKGDSAYRRRRRRVFVPFQPPPPPLAIPSLPPELAKYISKPPSEGK